MKRFGFFTVLMSWLLLAGCISTPLRETHTPTPDVMQETVTALQTENAQLATQVAGLPATIENLPTATPLPSATPTATTTAHGDSHGDPDARSGASTCAYGHADMAANPVVHRQSRRGRSGTERDVELEHEQRCARSDPTIQRRRSHLRRVERCAQRIDRAAHCRSRTAASHICAGRLQRGKQQHVEFNRCVHPLPVHLFLPHAARKLSLGMSGGSGHPGGCCGAVF